MEEINLVELLASENFAIYNKNVAKKLGIENAILLGTLCSLQKYYKNEEFYRGEKELSEDTLLSVSMIRKCKKELEDAGVLIVEKKGLPARHYFKINSSVLYSIITSSESTCTSSCAKTCTTGDIESCTTINNKENSIENNTENISICNNVNGNVHNISNYSKGNTRGNTKNTYGVYKRIKLTEEEYSRLCKDYGKEYIDNQINLLDEYVESNNNKNKYTNFNLVLRKSIRENWFQRNSNRSGGYLENGMFKTFDGNITDLSIYDR